MAAVGEVDDVLTALVYINAIPKGRCRTLVESETWLCHRPCIDCGASLAIWR